MNLDNAFVFDIESYPNLFVLVARPLKEGEGKNYLKFVIGDTQDDYTLLQEWLKTKPVFVGFNNLFFDAQLIEKIHLSPKKLTPLELNQYADEIIARQKEDRFDVPVSEWNLSFLHIDLYTISHFDNKRTSLKWLEFSMRSERMMDLPIPVGSHIPPSSVDKVVSYCKNDVDATTAFFYKCLPMIEHRRELAKRLNNPRILNMSNASIGVYIVKDALKKAGLTDKQLKKTVVRRSINIADHILDYIRFSTPEFNQILDTFKNTVLHNVDTEGLKGVHDQIIDFRGVKWKAGLGGAHAACKPGIYESDEENVIVSLDVSSFYPWLAIANKFYPEHLGVRFCTIYEELYNERRKYPKGTAMNKFLKESLVCVYGSSNQKFSFLYDPVFTIKTTVNGQLSLAMLAEELSNLGQILLCNTDGMEIHIPRTRLKDLQDACEIWQGITGLKLESDTYKKMVIRDVNAYWAINESGTIKRKNLFRTYEDFTEEGGKDHSYSENPSGTIIAEALDAYYANGTPVEVTINNCNSIYPFLYGIKGQKSYDYWFITANDEGVIDIEKRSERAIRFFIKKRGANIYKFWKDDRKNNIQAVKKGFLVESAMTIKKGGEIISVRKKKGQPNEVVVNYEPNLDYYIGECYSIIDDIERGVVEGGVDNSSPAELEETLNGTNGES